MKAVALFSGGLDSILAVKLISEQGIEVVAVKFYTPFLSKEKKELKLPENLKAKTKTIDISREFLKILKKPRFGYGSAANPCIDCKILMLKQAKKYAKKIGAKFIFTGEVLGERPMTQNIESLKLIEKKAGLKGKLLRPLSAKLLPETEAEKRGWVDRNQLLSLRGRNRKPQIALAKKLGITPYPSPGGGCLLTEKEFAKKVFDLIKNKKNISVKDAELLKFGRHFRFNENKVIVGRNEGENEKLAKLKDKKDYIFEVPDVGSPITLLQGPKTKKSITLAARLTARYSDSKDNWVFVEYGRLKPIKKIRVNKLDEKEIEKIRI